MFFDYNDVNFNACLSLLKWYAIFQNNARIYKIHFFLEKQVLW